MAIARILNNYTKKQDADEGEETPAKKSESKSASACPCIAKLLELQQSVHLAHWATTSYAEHKALNKLYEGLDGLIDTFVETLIGIKGRGVISGISTLKVYGSAGGDCLKIVNELETLIRGELKDYIDSKEDGLLNIQADMLNLVTHIKYLLTLK
jgi:DNA-binding ferritin-like protein